MSLRTILIGEVLLFGGSVQATEMCGFYDRLKNHASPESPLISDCQNILQSIEYTDDQWTVDGFSHHTLIKNGTCAVGVETQYYMDPTVVVGNVDVKRVVNWSIERYGTNGLVSTKGWMMCARTVVKGVTNDGMSIGMAAFCIYHT